MFLTSRNWFTHFAVWQGHCLAWKVQADLEMLVGKVPHVAEGGSDKHAMYLYKRPNFCYTKHSTIKKRHFLHFSLTSLCTWASIFPHFVAKPNVSHQTQINKKSKFGLSFWFFLPMRGFITAEWAFSQISLKSDRSLPYSGLNWHAIQAAVFNQLPIESLHIILSSHAFVLHGWPAFLVDLNWCHCKAVFEKSQIWNDQWLKGHPFNFHLDNFLSQAFIHLRVACHLAISMKIREMLPFK